MDKKVLKWNFIFQYGWVLTNVVNSILLLPFYIKYIDITTLGVWLACTGILNWMAMVDPGIGEVLQQKIAEYWGKKQHTDIGKSIGSGMVASGMIVILAVLVGILCYFSIGFFIDKDVSKYQHLPMALLVTIFATGLSLVSFTFTGINQGLQNTAQVAISSLSANFVFLFVNLLFLYLGFGVMSIAIANLTRALFINVYIFISMKKLLNREQISIILDWEYFRKFIRIFSFTSASKIITGLSNSLDMIVLARYIAPSMITVYEINKRPLNLTNTLIGRHSVALMPVISHTKGMDNKEAIVSLINKQLKFYVYAALFAAFMFTLNYFNLLTVWVGEGKYIGDTILYLLVMYNFVGLISYFMSNVGYALGDIKKNSKFNIIRNIFYGIFIVIAARLYGIIGTVVVSLAMSLLVDLFFFSNRLFKLGYLQTSMVKNLVGLCLVIVPACAIGGWLLRAFVDNNFAQDMYLTRLITTGVCFSVFYVILILLIDQSLRNDLKNFKNKLSFTSASV